MAISGPIPYLHFIEGHPAVRGEVLQHGNQELKAAVPVTQQQHHSNQIEDPHHSTGQVVGHMEDLEYGSDIMKIGQESIPLRGCFFFSPFLKKKFGYHCK